MRRAAFALLLASATPATAQPVARATSAAAADARLIALLDGHGGYAGYFAPSFQRAVPPAQLAATVAALQQALGRPRRVAARTAEGVWAETLVVAFERGTATLRLARDPAPPHRVTGLQVTGTTRRDDSLALLQHDVQALPGSSGLGIYALGDGEPRAVAEWRGDAPAPLGSAFKLWLLAEAARSVAAGERQWRDVVPLGARSLPSGILQDWPAGTPLTLQSLATLAISISDNTAADTLLGVLGRERVSGLAATLGADPRGLPLLSTREAFVLKGDPALGVAWAAGDAAARAALLAREAARLHDATLDPALFGGRPVASETVEWFASPRAVARTLDWLRTRGDATTRAILAVNAGTDAATLARFDYVGFKGGSEPGVITLNYLVQTRDGRWFAVAGNWHRPDAATPTLRFAALMGRALALVGGGGLAPVPSPRP